MVISNSSLPRQAQFLSEMATMTAKSLAAYDGAWRCLLQRMLNASDHLISDRSAAALGGVATTMARTLGGATSPTDDHDAAAHANDMGIPGRDGGASSSEKPLPDHSEEGKVQLPAVIHT